MTQVSFSTGFKHIENKTLTVFFVQPERMHLTVHDEQTGEQVFFTLDPDQQSKLLTVLLTAKEMNTPASK